MLAFKPHKGSLSQLAFSPDGASVVTSGKTPMLCVSDAATGKPRWTHSPNRATAIGLGVAFSPDGTLVATADWGNVSVFDATTGESVREFPGRGYAVGFTPDGKAVVSAARRPGVSVFRTNLRSGMHHLVPGLGRFDHLNRFAHSPDGKLFAIHADNEVSIRDVKTGTLRNYYPLSNAPSGVGALVFDPTRRFFVYSDGPELVAFDRVTGRHITPPRRSTKHVQEAAFTPDGRHLITVSNDETAVVWETNGWTEIRSFAWEIGKLKSVAVSPDRARAACGSDRGRVVVWDLDV